MSFFFLQFKKHFHENCYTSRWFEGVAQYKFYIYSLQNNLGPEIQFSRICERKIINFIL